MKQKCILVLLMFIGLTIFWVQPAHAEGVVIPGVNIGVSTSDNPQAV